jgi:metal-dependent hydrolase (beta-lactamase superfamily II)
MAQRLDQSTLAIPRGGYRGRFFFQRFLRFIKHAKPTKEDPVILVLDGHYSHTRNLEVISLARENRVDIICHPSHSSHKIQPLDKYLIGPLKHCTANKPKNGSNHIPDE